MDSGPDIEAHVHHAHTGRPLLDLVLSVSAIVVSLVSLFLAVQHGEAMERLVQANSWPFVMAGMSTADPDGTPHFSLMIQNKGVGPAKIESLEVSYRGRPVAGPHALMRQLLPDRPDDQLGGLVSDIVHSVLSAHEDIRFWDFGRGTVTKAEQAQLVKASQALSFRTCYCSVFDECWLMDAEPDKVARERVKACQRPAVPFQG